MRGVPDPPPDAPHPNELRRALDRLADRHADVKVAEQREREALDDYRALFARAEAVMSPEQLGVWARRAGV